MLVKEGEIMGQGNTDLPAANIIAEIESIFNVLREYDISVHESNRFNLFYKDFKNLIAQNNLKERFSELLEGMRDFFEIRSIVQSTEILSNSKEELTSVFGELDYPPQI